MKEKSAMGVEEGTLGDLDDWVAMRQALWPDES